MHADLVLFALGGVQRFLSESRTTADVAGASRIIQMLARRAADAARGELTDHGEPYGLIVPVLPAGERNQHGTTNKIAFLAPAGKGPAMARAVAAAVRDDWASRVRRVFGQAEPTPGVPDVSWVCITGSAAPEDYAGLWDRARAALVARRRARVFAPLLVTGRSLCSQSPHLPASPPPKTHRRHEADERLSAAGWVKRMDARQPGVAYPSTVAIASTTFRARLMAAGRERGDRALTAAVGRLADVVAALDLPREHSLPPDGVAAQLQPLADRLGAWVYADRWDARAMQHDRIEVSDETAAEGRAAAAALVREAERLGVPPPTPYYAVVVQDLDKLGEALGRLTLDGHREVSATLGALAAAQWDAAGRLDPPARPIYAGGDDFLAFCPASSALDLAAAARGLVREHAGILRGADGRPITASTAVVFAHMGSPMQEAVSTAQEALKQAKETEGPGGSRDALCVVVRRRGGERARLIQPWGPDLDAVELLTRVRPSQPDRPLSPGLASRLELDAASLDELARHGMWLALSKELRRLVERQGGDAGAAQALDELGRRERAGAATAANTFRPVPAALTARFLTQECR